MGGGLVKGLIKCNFGDFRSISSRSNKFKFQKEILNSVEKCIPPFFRSRRQPIIARNDFQKRSIALEIVYCSISFRFDLRSIVTAPEVTKGQGLYSRLRDFR